MDICGYETLYLTTERCNVKVSFNSVVACYGHVYILPTKSYFVLCTNSFTKAVLMIGLVMSRQEGNDNNLRGCSSLV